VHDGTLPLDKIAMMDIWKEILMGVVNPQEIQAGYDGGKIFEYVAELGGAKNIESFRRLPEGGLPPVMQPQIAPEGVDPAGMPGNVPLPFPSPQRTL